VSQTAVAPLFRLRGSRTRPSASALIASVLLHGALFASVWWSTMHIARPPVEFRTYRVNIVSPPPQELGQPDLVTSTVPTPAPPKESAPAPDKAVKPKPQPKTPPTPRASTAEIKKKTPAKGWNPRPGAEVGGSGLNVQIAGEDFPYPDYLNNIILQINRYFRWTGTPGLKAKVYFVVNRDGSVSDIRVLERSGAFAFDLQAEGAIEAAGKNKEFGALPRGYEPRKLPVELYIEPPR
jgi:outer membrane biosynthesis protein TonB